MNIQNALGILISGNDLSYDDCSEIFKRIMANMETEMDQGAFLAAITAKGASPDEIASICNVIRDHYTNKTDICTGLPLVENSGTGMDTFKTFNISTAASIAAASCGIAFARHDSRGITSGCGAVDVCEALGINVECDVETVRKSIEVCGLGVFNGMSGKVHPDGLSRILSKMHFGSVLNIAASLASPTKCDYALRGVNDPSSIKEVANLMNKLGYKKVMVIHGFMEDGTPGMDEATTLGRTIYTMIDEYGNETSSSFMPEEIGLERGSRQMIETSSDPAKEAVRIRKILKGEASTDEENITALNAGLILYLTGKTNSIQEGISMVMNGIKCGNAQRKLDEWISLQQ